MDGAAVAQVISVLVARPQRRALPVRPAICQLEMCPEGERRQGLARLRRPRSAQHDREHNVALAGLAALAADVVCESPRLRRHLQRQLPPRAQETEGARLDRARRARRPLGRRGHVEPRRRYVPKAPRPQRDGLAARLVRGEVECEVRLHLLLCAEAVPVGLDDLPVRLAHRELLGRVLGRWQVSVDAERGDGELLVGREVGGHRHRHHHLLARRRARGHDERELTGGRVERQAVADVGALGYLNVQPHRTRRRRSRRGRRRRCLLRARQRLGLRERVRFDAQGSRKGVDVHPRRRSRLAAPPALLPRLRLLLRGQQRRDGWRGRKSGRWL
mmetsp:Transcript_35157/g.83962  ORF Transcript_35157/g.83962 Transcript_35157/m.83962 type:complete len:331 (+) Transcript_35157:258-1250(+)